MKRRKVIEMIIDSENEDEWGVNAISLVSSPAIERDYLMFSKEQKELQRLNEIKLMNEEKRIVVGPILIPDMEIYRQDPTEGEYYIKFSKDTVRKASELYLTRSHQHNVTEEHEGMIEGVTLIESWIKEGEIDKSAHLGFKGLPNGTWLGTMKIYNDTIWDKVKEGHLKGYSIEGLFAPKLSKEEPTLMDKIEAACREVIGI